jgi:hypothetical protein
MTPVLGKWKLVVYLVGIFAAGAVSGWVVSAKATKEQMRKPPPWRDVYKSLKDLCYARLQLNPMQKEQFDAIIEDHTKLMESMHKNQMRLIREATSNRSARIIAILTPEQQKEFEAIEKERQEWRKGPKGPSQHGKERPPGPPPPESSEKRSCAPKSQRSS